MKPNEITIGEFYAFERKERLFHPMRAKVLSVVGEDANVEIEDLEYDAKRREWVASQPGVVSGAVPCRTLHKLWREWVAEHGAFRARMAENGARIQADRAAATRAVAACSALGIVARHDSLTNDIRVTSTERLAAILEKIAKDGIPAGPA